MPRKTEYWKSEETRKKAITRASAWNKAHVERRREISREYGRRRRGSTTQSLEASTTHEGHRREEWAAKLIGATHNNELGWGSRYDLDWRGLRLDVKSCELYKPKRKKYSKGWWVFNRNKNLADAFFCVCLEEGFPVRLYLIPESAFARTGITIGYYKSKFDEYRVTSISNRPVDLWILSEFRQ